MLTRLQLGLIEHNGVLPDSFLAELHQLDSQDARFPGLSRLLLSATHLVHLDLYDIPRSGYITPDVI